MTKVELAKAIGASCGITQVKASEVIDSVFAEIGNAIRSGDKVALHQIGTFTPHDRAAGERNSFGTQVQVAAKRLIKFKPATAYDEAIQPPQVAAKKAAPKK